jgi:hypothetical protein
MTRGSFWKNIGMVCGFVALVLVLGALPVNAQEQGAALAPAAAIECLDSAATPAQEALQVTEASPVQPAAEKTTSTVDTNTTTNTAAAQDEKQPPAQKSAAAPATDDFNKFRVLIIPYAWFATTSTELKVGDRTAQSVVTPGQAAKLLDAAFAARLEASQGHFGGFIDVNSLKLGDTIAPNYRNVDLSFSSGINNFALFYRFKGTPVFDIYAGARTYSFSTDITIAPGRRFPGRTISRSNDWTDTIIGARMNAPLSKNLGIIVDGDLGGGSGSNSWQLEGLIDWKLSQSFSLQGGYKSLYFENSWNNARIDGLSVKSQMYGPILKLQFGF